VLEAVRGGSANGLGGCCSAEVEKEIKVLCLKVQSGLCREPMSRVVELVDRLLRQRGLADVRIGVDVSVSGEVGPRCEPTDPACGPVPARKRDAVAAHQTACVAGRVLLGADADADEAARGRGRTCAHDGECLVVGCARECLRWDQTESLTWCDLVYEPSPKQPPTYCGCVAGRCDWFRPPAP